MHLDLWRDAYPQGLSSQEADPLFFRVVKILPCVDSETKGCNDGMEVDPEAPITCMWWQPSGAWQATCVDPSDIGYKHFVMQDSGALRAHYIETGPKYALENGKANKYQWAEVNYEDYVREV